MNLSNRLCSRLRRSSMATPSGSSTFERTECANLAGALTRPDEEGCLRAGCRLYQPA